MMMSRFHLHPWLPQLISASRYVLHPWIPTGSPSCQAETLQHTTRDWANYLQLLLKKKWGQDVFCTAAEAVGLVKRLKRWWVEYSPLHGPHHIRFEATCQSCNGEREYAPCLSSVNPMSRRTTPGSTGRSTFSQSLETT